MERQIEVINFNGIDPRRLTYNRELTDDVQRFMLDTLQDKRKGKCAVDEMATKGPELKKLSARIVESRMYGELLLEDHGGPIDRAWELEGKLLSSSHCAHDKVYTVLEAIVNGCNATDDARFHEIVYTVFVPVLSDLVDKIGGAVVCG